MRPGCCATLQHPNIPETYDSGRVFGTYFIAMEYIPGRTLKDLITHCRTTVGPVPEPIVLNLAMQLCDALDYAHKRCDEHGRPLGIIHRDVTPANLILAPTGVLSWSTSASRRPGLRRSRASPA